MSDYAGACPLAPMVPPGMDRVEGCWAVYRSGYVSGWDAGWKAADEDAANLQREAARIVHALANVPPRDRGEDRRRAEARDAYFAGSRRDGGPQ